MAKDFDIFLHRHLTECDLIIQSIPFRDGVTVTDRMILDACLHGCKLMRIAAVHSSAELVARIDRMIKICREKLSLPTMMDVSVGLKAIDVARPAVDPLLLSAENLGTLATVLNNAEAGMVVSTEPLVTKISKFLGHINTEIALGPDTISTLKKSILTLRSGMYLDAGLIGDLKTGLLLDIDTDISMDATLGGLCKRIAFDAAAGIEMAAIVLGTRISHSLGRAISGLAIDSKVTGTKAKKIEAAEGIIQLMADMAPILIGHIYPDENNVLLDADITGLEIKRYRLLSEMDDLSLEGFDNMALNEVDYVILSG